MELGMALAKMLPNSSAGNLGGVGRGTAGPGLSWEDVLLALAGDQDSDGWKLVDAKYLTHERDPKNEEDRIARRRTMRKALEVAERLAFQLKRELGRKYTEERVRKLARAVLMDYVSTGQCEVCDGVGSMRFADAGPDEPAYQCSACEGSGRERISQRKRSRNSGVDWQHWRRHREFYEELHRRLMLIEDRVERLFYERTRH